MSSPREAVTTEPIYEDVKDEKGEVVMGDDGKPKTKHRY